MICYIVYNKDLLSIDSTEPCQKQVTLVEWLTRGPANKSGRAFGRVGSNPAGDEIPFLFFRIFEMSSAVSLLCTQVPESFDLGKKLKQSTNRFILLLRKPVQIKKGV